MSRLPLLRSSLPFPAFCRVVFSTAYYCHYFRATLQGLLNPNSCPGQRRSNFSDSVLTRLDFSRILGASQSSPLPRCWCSLTSLLLALGRVCCLAFSQSTSFKVFFPSGTGTLTPSTQGLVSQGRRKCER